MKSNVLFHCCCRPVDLVRSLLTVSWTKFSGRTASRRARTSWHMTPSWVNSSRTSCQPCLMISAHTLRARWSRCSSTTWRPGVATGRTTHVKV